MPGWAKALIIVAVLLVLLVVGVIGAGVYWWSNNKDALIARGKAVVAEGQEAGRQTDNQGCVDQSITRYKAEPGFTSGISTSIFMQSCLQVSRPTPGFCDDVPKETEFVKSGQWQLAQCERVGLGSDQYCRQLFQTVERFCNRHEVSTTARLRVGLSIVDLRLPIADWLIPNANLKSPIDNRQSKDPPATAWWY